MSSSMSDSEYLALLVDQDGDVPPHLDDYAFSERVSIKLECFDDPGPKQVDKARDEAFLNV